MSNYLNEMQEILRLDEEAISQSLFTASSPEKDVQRSNKERLRTEILLCY